jgi:hypothetical protein
MKHISHDEVHEGLPWILYSSISCSLQAVYIGTILKYFNTRSSEFLDLTTRVSISECDVRY